MTMRKNRVRRRALPAAALATILLAGCSSGHIGEDWQCPLAAGGSCASVAAADPAVPKTGVMQAPASGQPIRLLPRETETERADPAETEPRSCEAACGFDPFAWLARLFGGTDDHRQGATNAGSAMVDPSADVASSPTAAANSAPDRPDSAAALPAAAASGDDGLPTDDPRTGEVVARIWIAPFVDADGMYREGAYVRVVLEPAGWRLP
ncbi:MAG: TraV family lipoprotein [Rhodospirillaceae bacterium]|nr:TraV family lipoprotein [Rhodospirillaceae bacterium]MYB13990.1 TraV family lipoprotein [Rhodospirillaceae bacterium]MYI51048.1 TraV family lipoprotein [Rhodospirillaceae bacterium]